MARPTRIRMLLLALVVTLAACSDDGRSLREPGTGGATPFAVAAPQVTADLFVGVGAEFALRSPAVGDAGDLEARFGFNGGAGSPHMVWANTPPDAVELVLAMVEEGEDGRVVHWLMGGLDPTSTQAFEGLLPPGGVELVNDFESSGWSGPLVAVGEPPRQFEFRLYALGELSDLDPTQRAADHLDAIAAAAIDVAVLSATYLEPEPIAG